MKIGILTWLHNGNYGSILQAYALQCVLRNEGYDVKNINYHPTVVEKVKNLIKNKNSIKLFGEKWNAYLARKACKKPHAYDEKNKKFDVFLNKYFCLTQRYSSPQEIKSIAGEYDAYICGSDQIWSPMLLNPVFYFDFLGDKEKKIAYACSFGVTAIPIKKRELISKYLNGFNAISVREKEGAVLVEELIGQSVAILPDPTLLLSREQWDEIASNAVVKDNYILCYFLSYRNEYWTTVQDIAKKRKCKIVVIPTIKETYELNAVVVENIGPEEWIGLIKYAECVVTDSFHGCVFSIIYNKPFWALKRFSDNDTKSQNSRIYTLLEHFHLSNKIVTDDNNGEVEDDSVDEWNKINSIIARDSEYAKKWLDNTIGEIKQ